MLSRLVITLLPRSKRLLISWLQSPSAEILEPQKIKSDTVSPSISYLSSKTAETTPNINNTFGSGIANKHTGNSGSRSFAKEMRAVKLRSAVASHQKWTILFETIIKIDPFTTTQEDDRIHQPFYGCLALEANQKSQKA